MLTVKEKGLLLSIIKHCERIGETVAGLSKQEFDSSEMIKDVLCFNLLQIGELAKRFEPNFIKEYGNVPWKSIKGMRDRIVHGYGTILFDEVWNTAIKDILPLKDYCKKIIEENKQTSQ
jgi:uncharacterized protein with HEPN domain